MNHQKDGGQVGQTISHYPALRDPARRDKILEKPGEARPGQTHMWPIGGGLASDLSRGLKQP